MRSLPWWLERQRIRIRRRLAADHDPEDPPGPQFGYGLNDRPLWSERDWAAEEIRKVLRDAGCLEWSGLPPYQDGFVVEGGDNGEPFGVACTFQEPLAARVEVERYREALRAGEYRVELDPDDAQCLEVSPPPENGPR